MSRSLSATAFTKLLLSFITSFLLAACGGDKTPEPFSFTPLVDLAPDTLAVSNTVTISGIDSDVIVSISGGEYSVDGADFTSAAGVIVNDQTLQLRAQTALGFTESKTVVITLNEMIEEFKMAEEFELTTVAQDIIPEEFVFNTIENAAVNAWITSELVTIAGINDAIDITVDNVEYSIDGGEFTSSNGVVINGQSLRVRILSSSSFNTASGGSINAGNLSVPFSIITSGMPQIVSLDLVAGSEISVGEDLVASAVCIHCDESNTLYSWKIEGIEQFVSTENYYSVTAETVLKEISVSATAVNIAGDEGETVTRKYTKNRVKEIEGMYRALAALKYDGSVVTWGEPEFGGDSSSVADQLMNVKSISANYGAFAAVRSDGSVVTWGATNDGGDSSTVSDQLKNVQSISATARAFAAIKSDGSVVTWGRSGGDSSSVVDQLTGVKSISAAGSAFAAIKTDGSVVTWGDSDRGGNSSAISVQLMNVHSVSANKYGFAAIKLDGSVVTWGDDGYGGDSSSVADELVKVKSISSSWGAFAAIRENGSVVTWGSDFYGADSSSVAAQLIDVQSITATGLAFAAIRSDGSVVTWGHTALGGDSSSVTDELVNVRSISASSNAFAAIKFDGSVVTWGRPGYGSDSSLVSDQLMTVESVDAVNAAFAAIISDGSVVTWGDASYGGFSQNIPELEPGGIVILK
jgi:alpha-tubulin suppressor-like RCC1 family protein